MECFDANGFGGFGAHAHIDENAIEMNPHVGDQRAINFVSEFNRLSKVQRCRPSKDAGVMATIEETLEE